MGENEENNFKTPEGYFESFNERLMGKIRGEEETEKLSFLPKSDGFSVPEGYFQNLDQKMSSRLGDQETKVISLKTYRKYFYGAVAAAAVFLVIFGLNFNTETPVAFEDLASAEIDAYLESTELDLSSYELAEMVPIDEIEINDVVEEQLESENILEYLDENIEDIDELNLNFEDYE
ncbi:hypothetical protein [Flagellimonas allohymeniacidonis]|uniref:Uncharacterized protein n=1 Tax=Flagellimonas allohymeniacidonis TaxID=2517819 RepID=A0A4Q8QK85_9FLAO|nr:hypothetical protein [Allomuricauda hymeniacidonis]TAI49183.1 hypothetical protein EW142_05135 [Allomuricauda hymeniacidonis]